MVKASRPAATKFTASPISMTENSASTTPKPAASDRPMIPAGTARLRVRRIRASMSLS